MASTAGSLQGSTVRTLAALEADCREEWADMQLRRKPANKSLREVRRQREISKWVKIHRFLTRLENQGLVEREIFPDRDSVMGDESGVVHFGGLNGELETVRPLVEYQYP